MKTTVEEWEILQAVVQLGGFAPAAQRLNIICKDLNPGGRELSALAELLGINRDLELI
jgi:hypothetical protein